MNEEKCVENKTLMNSLRNLNGRICQLDELKSSSKVLLNRMLRVETISEKQYLEEKVNESEKNIVYLFDEIDIKLGKLISDINDNLNQTISMIE